MCGIAGFINREGDWRRDIEAMNARLYHRGPDAGGFWSDSAHNVVLGHRRLSIQDLSNAGAQPMVSRSGLSVLSYNGEIYNFKEIKNLLIRDKKMRFKGTSDTEILLEALEAYGVPMTLKLVKGMFAFAYYDMKKKELTLARDRIGEKPLYYGFVGNGNGERSFVFASELGAIRTLEGFDNPVNTDVLNIYFIHGYIPAPYTIYKNISKLEPGQYLTIGEPYEKPVLNTYWSIRETAIKGQNDLFQGSEEEAAEELESLLKATIRQQMVADVPVGAFLSAGIDSSTIVSLMAEVSPQKPRTFTIGMEEGEYNEAPIAKEIADILGTDHTELYISEKDAKAVIPKLAHIYSEPFADSSQIPTYLVSSLTRRSVTVSLSGDAGDELFCGYGTYSSVERIWNKMGHVPYFIRKPVSALLLVNPFGKGHVYKTKSMLLGARDPAQLYEFDNMEEPLSVKVSLNKTIPPYAYNTYRYGGGYRDGFSGYADENTVKSLGGSRQTLTELNHNIMLMDMLMYHPDDILTKVDRSGMAVSLETRIPLLDRDVVEFAWRLPIEYKKKEGVTKKVLRDILYKRVPKELMERPKKGFSIPIAKWLKDKDLYGWARDLLAPEKIRNEGFLDAEVVQGIWEDYDERGVFRPQIWYLLMFESWVGENVAVCP
ncbi:MAG: asparagine synthase (glutamine-hydrolyzing) [Lachnospiraceae bacterium]|nr:asparagine synthase (glutamine-hydrolyzing) [Lachnospiraceae bacterium]